MKAFIFVMLLLLSVGVTQAYRGDEKVPPNEQEIEAVEVVEMEEVEIVDESSHGIFLGIPKHRWMTVSGPIIWVAIAAAIGTRYIRLKGRARQLSKIHKICGFTALGVGTLHGLLGLFF
jgi:hypothetical protein